MISYFGLARLALYIQEEEVDPILPEVALQGHHPWYLQGQGMYSTCSQQVFC